MLRHREPFKKNAEAILPNLSIKIANSNELLQVFLVELYDLLPGNDTCFVVIKINMTCARDNQELFIVSF